MKFSLIRYTNEFILVTLAVLALSGAYALFWTWQPWVFDLHRAAGMLLVAAIPWKAAISWASLKRRIYHPRESYLGLAVSLLLAALALGVILLGFAWYWRLSPIDAWLGQTVIAWHWILGLGLAAPLAVHIWQRWLRPRKADFVSRRAFLRTALLGSVGLFGWAAGDWLARERSQAGAGRRFTGSRESGSGSGNLYPVTNNPGEGFLPVNPDTWRLNVVHPDGSAQSISYAELLAMPKASIEAAVDCTLGWYSTHHWQGIPLASLLDLKADSGGEGYGVLLQAVSGYGHVIPFPEANNILLATHVDGQVLDQAHGFPLRAVVPSRRGWFWVKWVSQVALIYSGSQ